MKITPLDRGIEDIQWQSDKELEVFDNSASIIPGDASIESFLDEILAPHGFMDRLLESISPQVENRHVLQPYFFQVLTQNLPGRLKDAAQEASTPQAKRAFLTAADILEEQRQNMEILNAYRKLLIKG
ncbi:MAG: hypothetical protein ACP5TY_00405 [Thermodesulforhabdaceae bacterium]|jgi:hypothetical protein